MTTMEAQHELAALAESLSGLTTAAEATARGLDTAQERLEGIDSNLYHGRVSGRLASALEDFKAAEEGHRRATSELVAARRRQAELLKTLRTEVCRGESAA